MMKIERSQPDAPVASATGGLLQELSVKFHASKTETLNSTSMSSSRTPDFPSLSCFQSYQQMLNHTGSYLMGGVPGQFLPDGGRPWSSMAVNETMHLPAATLQRSALNWQVLHNPQTPPMVLPAGSAGDTSSCQLADPPSSLPQGATTPTRARSYQKPSGGDVQRRELRLMKNREAARECRRKKKEYVRCLENRVVGLENQNKSLMEELRALRDICHLQVE